MYDADYMYTYRHAHSTTFSSKRMFWTKFASPLASADEAATKIAGIIAEAEVGMAQVSVAPRWEFPTIRDF